MTKADDEIEAAIRTGNGFFLDAGAGSGKTSSLVRALTLLRMPEFKDTMITKRQQVACITYTNVAKDEIIERTEHDGLIVVSTIHQFLWNLVKPYQAELKLAVARFNNELSERSRRRKDPAELAAAIESGIKIDYSEFGSNFLEGRIHHDDLIGVAAIMFEDNPLLCRLTASQFPYIFVDEYQDTSPLVVSILLDHIRAQNREVVLGFFGDKVQSIYGGVGELSDAHKALLTQIQKEENYRCAVSVIDLLNRFRTDIRQVPAGKNVPGAAVYVGFAPGAGRSAQDGYAAVSDRLVDPPDFSKAKVLYLTHRLIAREAGYNDLFETYRARGGFAQEQFQQGDEPVASFLAFVVEALAATWREGDHAKTLSLLQAQGFKLESVAHKAETSAELDQLSEMVANGHLIGEVIDHLQQSGLIRLPDKLIEGIALANTVAEDVTEDDQRLWTFFTSLLTVGASQLHTYRQVLEKNMPYATKHGVKGDEFDTVIVVLDDAGASWNQYAFGKRLEGQDTSEARWDRTGNLFYVCCSRARINLVVVDLGYTPARRSGVEALFGAENVIS
jgi:DNA helicase-2/ATP-dependent DNA helicase PcrA